MPLNLPGYWEVTELVGGVYVGGTNWSTQFTTSGTNVHGVSTIGGELALPLSAVGKRARLAISTINPTSITVWVENVGPVSPDVQLIVNGSIIGEYVSGQYVAIPLIGSTNIIELVVALGGIVLSGKLLAAVGLPVSLYPAGQDPFNFASSGSGGFGPVSSQGTSNPSVPGS